MKKPIGHISLWQLFRNKYFLVMALVCSGASATGSVLSVWQPQLLKSFGLTNMQTGFINSIPYGIATVVMILWGQHSDRSGERRWHTAIPLLLAGFGLRLWPRKRRDCADRTDADVLSGGRLRVQRPVLVAFRRMAIGEHDRGRSRRHKCTLKLDRRRSDGQRGGSV